MKSILAFILGFSMAGAWLTHVIACLLSAEYLLLIAGAIIFPVGIIRGFGLWFGVNW